MLNVNLGHFVSTYGVHLRDPVHYDSPLGLPNQNLNGDSLGGYFSFTIPASDELYVGSVFRPGVTFGRGVGEIQRFFANDHFEPLSSNSNNGRHDTAGWTKLYDGSADGTVGRIVYLQQGETMTRMFAHECLSTGL